MILADTSREKVDIMEPPIPAVRNKFWWIVKIFKIENLSSLWPREANQVPAIPFKFQLKLWRKINSYLNLPYMKSDRSEKFLDNILYTLILLWLSSKWLFSSFWITVRKDRRIPWTNTRCFSLEPDARRRKKPRMIIIDFELVARPTRHILLKK